MGQSHSMTVPLYPSFPYPSVSQYSSEPERECVRCDCGAGEPEKGVRETIAWRRGCDMAGDGRERSEFLATSL